MGIKEAYNQALKKITYIDENILKWWSLYNKFFNEFIDDGELSLEEWYWMKYYDTTDIEYRYNLKLDKKNKRIILTEEIRDDTAGYTANSKNTYTFNF